MKSFFTVTAAFLSPVFIAAQSFQIDKPILSADSLKKVLPLLHDSARIDCLNELARSYIEGGSYLYADSSLTLAKQAYKEASAINYIKGMGDACQRYGVVSRFYIWDSHKMEKDYREAIMWYKKTENDDGLGNAFLGLGMALRDQGFPDAAKSAFEQSAVHFRKTGNKVMLAELTDQFGLVYDSKGDFEKYFESIKQGLREKKSIGDNRGLVWSYYRLGHIYQSSGDYETALNYFRQSFQQASSQSIAWRIYTSMGTMFFDLKNYDSAFFYYRKIYILNPLHGGGIVGMGKISLLQNEHARALGFFRDALTVYEKTGNLQGEAAVFAEMGKANIELKRFKTALLCGKESLAIATEINSKEIMQSAYEIHWNVFEALQQIDSAYFYYRKFVALRDSLDNAKFRRQHLQKLALYKAEAKEEQQQTRIDLLNKDNQLKQQQLQKEALLKKILTGSLIALAVLGTIIFRNITLKRKNEKHQRELAENELQIQRLESEKTKAEFQQQATELEMQALRAQMNPHFIFNCLSSINRFILKNETEAASDYLIKFSRLIRMVLTNSKKTFISLEDELDMLRLYLDMERLRFKNAFDYSISLKNEIEPENIFMPPLLFQPFAENAIWHGLMHKEGHGHLEIALSADKKVLTCMITDDGIGRDKAVAFESKSAQKQKSMGLQITTERLALLNQERDKQSFFRIEDITDDEGNIAGTRVILKMHYRDLADAIV